MYRTDWPTAKCSDDVLQILGRPDAVFDYPEARWSVYDDKSLKWTKCYAYTRQWKSLTLNVLELPDGSITWFAGGQFTGGAPASCPPVQMPRKPWWKFW